MRSDLLHFHRKVVRRDETWTAPGLQVWFEALLWGMEVAQHYHGRWFAWAEIATCRTGRMLSFGQGQGGTAWGCAAFWAFFDFQKQIFSKISPEKWVGRSFMYAAFAWPCLACGCLGGAVSCAGSCGAHHLSCHFWCLVFAGVKMTKIRKAFHEMCLTCSNEIPSMKL